MDEEKSLPTRPRLVVDNAARPSNALRVRMNTIAHLIGMPAARFFEESSARAQAEGPTGEGIPTHAEIDELQSLFGRVRNPDLRRDCLSFVRAQARQSEI